MSAHAPGCGCVWCMARQMAAACNARLAQAAAAQQHDNSARAAAMVQQNANLAQQAQYNQASQQGCLQNRYGFEAFNQVVRRDGAEVVPPEESAARGAELGKRMEALIHERWEAERRANLLADQNGVLADENRTLAIENSRLRREVERLTRKGGRR